MARSVRRGRFAITHPGDPSNPGRLPRGILEKLAGLAADSDSPRLRRYALWEPLGEGATGIVYRAEDLLLRRKVAVKVLKEKSAHDAAARERFIRESEVAAHLSHPNLVTVHDVGEEDGRRFIVMELVQGRSLREKIETLRDDLPRGLSLMKQVAAGVHYAHTQGVVHRDLKPDNILITDAGEAKVTDFGLAQRLDGQSSLTATGAMLGTPSYMAPEQVAGRREQISGRTDVYALGVILYELVTGLPPHTGSNAMEVTAQILAAVPVSPVTLRPDLPLALDAIILKALAKDPADRFETAGALADELERFLAGLPTLTRPVSPIGRAWMSVRRQRRLVVLVTAALLSTVGITSWIHRVTTPLPVIKPLPSRFEKVGGLADDLNNLVPELELAAREVSERERDGEMPRCYGGAWRARRKREPCS
jgi:eukaryotic-like serine/threonine-protein kinase